MNSIKRDRFERNSTPRALLYLHENGEHAIATTQGVRSTYSNRATHVTTGKVGEMRYRPETSHVPLHADQGVGV